MAMAGARAAVDCFADVAADGSRDKGAGRFEDSIEICD